MSDWITFAAGIMLAVTHGVAGALAYRDWRRREFDGCGERIGWLVPLGFPVFGPLLYLLVHSSGTSGTGAPAPRPVHEADSANDEPSTTEAPQDHDSP